MKEYRKWEKSQWIPWELSYSIKETNRAGFVSHSNAILAVILPDRNNNYNYYNENNLFNILKQNIKNKYIPVVNWARFKYNCDYYINKAYEAKKNTAKYLLVKSV